jgi:hypothetical protein
MWYSGKISHIHYVIVSSGFVGGDPTKAIHNMKRHAPRCQSVCLVTSETLLRLVEVHLKHPDFTPTEIENILMKDGYILPDDIELEQ